LKQSDVLKKHRVDLRKPRNGQNVIDQKIIDNDQNAIIDQKIIENGQNVIFDQKIIENDQNAIIDKK
jgi:pyrrolidone-carboxylate peptidase